MIKRQLCLSLIAQNLLAANYSIQVDSSNPKVAEKILEGLENFNINYFATHHGNRDHHTFVIHAKDADGKVIGGLSGGIFGSWAYVDYASVEPEWRGQGLGTNLFLKLEELAKQHNCDTIQLFTFEFQAVGFYEKLGYERVGIIPKWVEDTYDACFYKKRLTNI